MNESLDVPRAPDRPKAYPVPGVTRERDAIQRVLAGDKNAYAVLVERYNGPLYRYLLGMVGRTDEAEDLAQDAFVRAYLSLASYDDHYRFSTWLFRIAHNLALNRLKAGQRIVSLDGLRDRADDQAVELPDAAEGSRPDHAAERSDLARLIRSCLESLPESYRSVVALRHIADLSYEEIALSIHLPINTVRSRLHRGRERLGECLEERMDASPPPPPRRRGEGAQEERL